MKSKILQVCISKTKTFGAEAAIVIPVSINLKAMNEQRTVNEEICIP